MTATLTAADAYGVDVDPVTNTAYVSDPSENSLTASSCSTYSVTGTINFPAAVNTDFTQAAVDPATDMAYVPSSNGSDAVYALDGATGTFAATIPVGSEPSGVAVNSTTNTIYVANSGSTTVSVINGATNTVTATINVPGTPSGLCVDVATNLVYAVLDGKVSVINGSSNAVSATVSYAGQLLRCAVDAATDTVYVTNSQAGTVVVISGGSNAVTGTIPLTGSNPYADAVAVDALTNVVYVTDQQNSDLDVINAANNTVVDTVSTGSGYGVDVDAATDDVYVSSGEVIVLDGTTNAIEGTVPVSASSVAVDTITDQVFGVGSDDLSVIAARVGPSAPTIVSSSRGDSEVTLAWDAPAYDGGSLESYVVVAAPKSGASVTQSVPPTQLSTTLTGLTDGTKYVVTVTADTSLGAGTPSIPITQKPAAAPSTTAFEQTTTAPPPKAHPTSELIAATGNVPLWVALFAILGLMVGVAYLVATRPQWVRALSRRIPCRPQAQARGRRFLRSTRTLRDRVV